MRLKKVVWRLGLAHAVILADGRTATEVWRAVASVELRLRGNSGQSSALDAMQGEPSA